MSNKQDLLYLLSKLISRRRSKQFYAERLGISVNEVSKLLKELRRGSSNQHSAEPIRESHKKVSIEKGTIESTITVSFEPRDHIELAKLHKIDLDKFTIVNYWSKLLPNGKFTSSIFSKKKEPSDYTIKDFSKFLDTYKSNYKPIEPPERTNKDIVDMELSLSDFHLAKRTIDGDNSPATRAFRYFNVAENLILKTRQIYDINTIVFPISNDFFHTDNYQRQTTALTPQDTILEYDAEYELGFAILVDTIQMLKANCLNVHVVLVQGNHDRTKSFYLAHGLEVFFKQDADIKFDRQHSVIKGITLGNTFIGYHHGNCKIDDLPLLFATHPKYSSMFGDSKYREVHTGDKHHYMAKDIKGVRIQQMPSLSGTDRWHEDNNFVHSVRAALALIYDYKTGKTAEFETRI